MKANLAIDQREIERIAAGGDGIVAREGGTAGTFAGYVAVWNEPDLRGEIVARGAFIKSLVAWHDLGKMPPLWVEHGEGEDVGIVYDPLAHLPVGEIMSLTEDHKGLRIEARLFDLNNELGRIARRRVASREFGFSYGATIRQRCPTSGARTEVSIREISIVTNPAQPEARIDFWEPSGV